MNKITLLFLSLWLLGGCSTAPSMHAPSYKHATIEVINAAQ